MSDQTITPEHIDPQELSRTLSDIAETSQQLVSDFLSRQTRAQHISVDDAIHMGSMFQELATRMLSDPMQLAQAQLQFWGNYMQLVSNAALRFWGQQQDPVITPGKGDKRFRHEAWEENPVFDFIKQSYLLAADFVHSSVKNVEGMDDKTARKIDFHTRQFIDALSPTNFAVLNPEVLEKTLESKGANLLKGLKNLLNDLEAGEGKLRIKMTDHDAFAVGTNLATTPGKVIHQTDLMQLIQYAPSTQQVYKRPLLFVPPWINKYYILDMQPKNSMIAYLVEQGHTVFTISWKNPGREHAEKRFEDYMREGPLAALDAITAATGETEINAVGYCLGGTLSAATLAYLSAHGDDRVKSITYFTCMLDFDEPGELEVFIDEEQLSSLEKRMDAQGYLEAGAMSATMSSLRANDLIWSFFVNNYLKGDDPFPFDLLYWNQDSTNMPAKMHSYYLRNMYQRNLLREPGGISLDGTPIDLSRITIPACFVSTLEDHIAPWKSTYKGVHLHSGPVKFILGGSGHIAGIINPPAKNKYCYWTRSDNPKSADAWLEKAKRSEGSWWPEWNRWLVRRAGAKVDPREPGAGGLPALEDAPGSYVKEKV